MKREDLLKYIEKEQLELRAGNKYTYKCRDNKHFIFDDIIGYSNSFKIHKSYVSSKFIYYYHYPRIVILLL